MEDKHSTHVTIEPFLHVVPDAEVYFSSPQNNFQGLNGRNFNMNEDNIVLIISSNEIIKVPYHHANNLPMFFLFLIPKLPTSILKVSILLPSI